MKLTGIKNLALIALLGLFSSTALAQSSAKAIADIVASVNHFPSDAQKMTLNEIANDAANSNAIRVIAKAVHDMQHAVAAADKTVLEGIAADSSASAAERTLAEIVCSNITRSNSHKGGNGRPIITIKSPVPAVLRSDTARPAKWLRERTADGNVNS